MTQRAMLLPVPAHPRSVHGKPQQTRALWRSHGGAMAVPAIVAVGHQLEQGQAVTLSRRNLFAPGSARPTMATRARATALAVSLSRVSAVTCEGYTDFGGDAAHEGRLAEKRAAKICSLLAAARPGLDTTTHGFGRQVPVVVGGRPAQRAANRRVVVVATEGLPATPPSTNPPSTDPPQRASAPDAPVLSSATGGTNPATLTFSAPASDGGSAVTGYAWSTDQTTWTPLTDRLLALHRPAERAAQRDPEPLRPGSEHRRERSCQCGHTRHRGRGAHRTHVDQCRRAWRQPHPCDQRPAVPTSEGAVVPRVGVEPTLSGV